MPVYLHGITTKVPAFAYPQTFIRDFVKAQFEGKETIQRIIHRMYSQSGIEQRHSCVWQTEDGTMDSEFFDMQDGKLKTRSTGVRNGKYEKESRPLFAAVAADAINKSGLRRDKITHVITVSCTGFYAPGPEFYVVKDLGLNPQTQRFHLGFMGCFAAFPAWKLAAQICQANPEANVLVICLELCTLHLQFKEETDILISGSVFADGAGGCVVSGIKPKGNHLEWISQSGHIAPEGEGDMAWTIGDEGFDMVLSTYIPKIIEANLDRVITETLEKKALTKSDISHWAIHPGGRAILDKVEQNLKLAPEKLHHARSVLAENGNMSSATIFFVLEKFLQSDDPEGLMYASAFGPGLTIESAIFSLKRS